MSWRPSLAVGLALLPCLVAQQPLPVVAVPQQEGDVVSAMRSFSQGLTADGDGRLWCLVHESRPETADARALWLCRSDDHGRSWARVAKTPGDWSVYGALAGEPGSSALHVAWATRVGEDEFSSAVYQRFDGEQGRWLGEPEVLQRGVGAEDQFGVCDLAVDSLGGVAVLVSTHRRPQRPPWPSGWSAGLMLRERAPATGPRAPAAWQGPFPIHTNTFGVWANLQLHEGRAHATYRTSPSHSMIGYRSFSLATRAFDQPQDVEVSVRPDSGRQVSNASALVVGPFGGRTVVYPAATQGGAERGQLLLAFSTDGAAWRTSVLAEDPPMKSGNVAHEHFALVRGPGRQVIALYSKVGEQFRVLYRRIVDGGAPMEDERVVATSDVPGAFQRVVAMRDARLVSGVWALVSGQGEAQRLGVRAVLAPRPAAARWQ